MRAQGSILRETMRGCMPIVVGFVLAMIFCLLVTLCGCKPQQKIVEVERLVHDTTTVIDTVHIKDVVTVHDSIFVTETVTEYVKDSTQTNVAFKYYTYDSVGNIASLLDYTSSVQHGKSSHTASQSASTAVNDQSVTHEEKSAHSESSGHLDASKEKNETKPQLSSWQRFIQGMGYTFLALLALALMFGGMRLYGKWKRL